MNLRINAETNLQSALMEESLSNENTADQPAYSFCEVATLNGDNYYFQQQEQFGRAYNKDDILVFHVTVTEPENIAYLIDLYAYSSRPEKNEMPYHLGYHYLLPNYLKKSEGLLELPITCASRHRPLGMMKLEYLKTTPLGDDTIKQDMGVNIAKG
jgi:glycerophosphocholine phosphodiesterase GPCPD1